MGKRCAWVCLLVFCLIFSACRSGEDEDSFSNIDMNTVELSVQELADELNSSLTFDDTLVPLDEEIAGRLYGIVGLYESVAAYGSTGATAEAVVVLRCADAEKAISVASFIEEYRKDMADVYAGYNMKESGKLKNAFLSANGKYVVFCVSPDTPAAEAAFRSLVVSSVREK